MVAFKEGKEIQWRAQQPEITERATGAVAWFTTNKNKLLTMQVKAKMECDGYINYWVTLTAKKDISLSDIQLQIPYNKEEATYMMGMGFKGGFRPGKWDWKWKQADANNMIWVGAVNAGLQCKLKNIYPVWNLYDFGKAGPSKDWSNGGKGGCTLAENNDAFLLKAFTGGENLKKGEALHFNFGLLITPVKILDKRHWSERYFQSDPPVGNWIERATKKGANIINVHQGNVLNPYINYPFIATDTLKNFISQARRDGIRTKIYYTVRELSDHTAELWALRSLGNEIFQQGGAGQLADQFSKNGIGDSRTPTGGSWLVEHLKTNYVPGWHTPLSCGNWD
ncbi:MAG: glycoside hydrolase domain-containing protein, partial [Rhabdochlamydiaceae bacterium]